MAVQFSGLSAVRLAAVTVLTLLFAIASQAQSITRQEAGVGAESETNALFDNLAPGSVPDYVGPRHIFPGPFGRYTVNLSPSLALEGRIGYLPGFQTTFGIDNGHELLAVGGIKAGWRGRRFGLYGTIEPGVASFSPGLNVNPNPARPPVYQRRTTFALDEGAALEFYPSPRTILRFDLSQTLLAEYDQVLARSPTSLVIHQGYVAQHLGLAIGVAHRFGALRTEPSTIPRRSPLDLGILYALQQRQHLSPAEMQANSALGAWTSWNFSPYLSFDAASFYDPIRDGYIFPQDGGATTALFTGFKAGIRRDRLGYFAKVRPGILQFSRTRYRDAASRQYWEKTTDFALDAGGVIEVYPSRHTILRFEGGNTFIHYHAAQIDHPPGPTEYFLPRRRPSILFLFGAGFRF